MNSKETASIASAFTSCGSSEFGYKLDALCRIYASFTMSCILVFYKDRAPVILHDGYSASIDRDALHLYLKGGYLLDPFYSACVSDQPNGLWRMQNLAPDNFHMSGFSLSKDIHPCISGEEGALVEEIGYIIDLGEGVRATYSLMRNSHEKRFSEREFTRLECIRPIIDSCLNQHWKDTRTAHQPPKPTSPELIFTALFGDKLTQSQRKVAQLVLRGHSNASIGAKLSITEGTAKVHRYNIYQRLNITSQVDLFRILIDHLVQH